MRESSPIVQTDRRSRFYRTLSTVIRRARYNRRLGVMRMARALATIIAEHQEEIAAAWIGRLHVVEGSGFAGRPDDEVGSFSRSILRALLSSIAEGHQDQGHAFVRQICAR